MRSINFRSNLSCMFSCDGSNYDWIENNVFSTSHRLPQLQLDASRYEELPQSYRLAQEELAYRALLAKMSVSAADVATMAKQHRLALTEEALGALATSNRPDSIPSDLKVIHATSWNEHGPLGDVLGTISAEAWRKGEAANIARHQPQPLPAYSVPQRSMTASEIEVGNWLAEPGRTVTKAKKSDRLVKLMARFWDAGDGHTGLQPVMAENAALRAQRMPLAVAAQ